MTTLLGKYRLDARLGGGGMAEVFIGSTVGAEGFSRRVAIKRVLPGFSENPQFSKMFIDEARISSRLVHPNIVSVIDFDRDPEGRLYLVMELVEGKDLDALASSGPLPIPVIIYTISEVLRGLGHAHDLPVVDDSLLQGSNTIRSMKGVVHRDVSPHNVLLSWEGTVKVSDFGIAKARTASEATASVFIKGKPAYMSPEQANGQSLDGRSDLFAVGVMLWEMLCGRRLFIAEDTRATLAAVLFGQIPRPRAVRGDVPKDLERVTMKLLERELPARYATAEEAIADLLQCDAAPKDGREVLKRTLAERFPQQAPVRHSVLRSRSGATPPPSQPGYTPQQGYPNQPGYPQLGPQQSTIADGAVGRHLAPAAAMPSIGEMRGAQTATMQPQHVGPAASVPQMPSSKKGKLAIIIASCVAAAAVLFAVIATVSRGDKKTPASPSVATAQGSGEAGSAATVVPAPTPDAAVPEATPVDAGQVVAAPTPDAGVPEAKKDATSVRPSEKRVGRLQVRAFPVLTVYVDNKKIRDTPVDMPLSVGKHKIRLVNTEVGKDESLTVTIEENKPTIIDRN